MAHHGLRRLRPEGEPIPWQDLQLPLYHYLVTRSEQGAPDSVELGYIVLPKQAARVAYRPAKWGPARLDEAIERAREVVRDIRAGRFEMSPTYRRVFDPFARICQTTTFSGSGTEAAEPVEVTA